MFAPDAVNLGGTDDGQKADQIRPDFIDDDQGEEAKLPEPIKVLRGDRKLG